MYEIFLRLPQEKQNTIINAALKVFAYTTYKRATTDDIIKEAGISKGALFHYFGNKQNLYLFLYDYATTILLKEFYDKVDIYEQDLFKRFNNILLTKILLMKKHPDLFNFMITVSYDDNILKSQIKDKEKILIDKNTKVILGNIDKSKFRLDINADLAIKMIIQFFEGYAQIETLKLRNLGISDEICNRWIKEINEYTSIMRKLYYKGE